MLLAGVTTVSVMTVTAIETNTATIATHISALEVVVAVVATGNSS